MRLIMAENSIEITIPFPSAKQATIAYEVLQVDEEVKRSGVTKNLCVDAETLKLTFHAEDIKKLRVAVNGIFKNILLIVKTIDLFSN